MAQNRDGQQTSDNLHHPSVRATCLDVTQRKPAHKLSKLLKFNGTTKIKKRNLASAFTKQFKHGCSIVQNGCYWVSLEIEPLQTWQAIQISQFHYLNTKTLNTDELWWRHEKSFHFVYHTMDILKQTYSATYIKYFTPLFTRRNLLGAVQKLTPQVRWLLAYNIY